MTTAVRGSWDDAPCGLLVLTADGTVADANPTALRWLGRDRDDVVGAAHLAQLLTVGGRIYWETHLAPLLHVERRLEEVALELRTATGRMPVLLTAVATGAAGESLGAVHVALSSAQERYRYERELLAARAAADRSVQQLRALQRTTAALSQALGVDGVGTALLDASVGPLGAQAATLWLVEQGGHLAPHGSAGEPEGSCPAPGTAQLAAPGCPVADGRVLVPLRGPAGVHGALSLLPPSAPAADPLDLEVLAVVGQQAGLALDRARMHEHSATVAHELQRVLRTVDVPEDPRYAVATAYRPSAERLEVGGDWSDVFRIDADVVAVVVGDVVGHDLQAAGAMGQLRSATRAVAGPDVGPGLLLTQLDRFVEQVEAASMATLAYAQLSLVDGSVHYACAGHPPPLLVPAHGEPRLLWGGRSTPLGAFGRPSAREEAQVHLGPGDRLLLYTDGLVERRDRSVDEGLRVLAAAAARLRGEPPEDFVRSLTHGMLDGAQDRDDVCVLLLACPGERYERHLRADLRELSAVRRELAGWLLARGVDPEVGEELVLATSEAVANAAEHGSGGRPHADVGIGVRIEQPAGRRGEVVVEVRDAGTWRAPVESRERGRGLGIIRSLVDDLAVTTGEGTTVVLRRRLPREVL